VLPVLAALAAIAYLVIVQTGRSAPSMEPAMAEIERMLDLAGFGLTQVFLTGHRLTSDSDIFDAIDLAATTTMLSFDSAAAQARIERLSAVEHARIDRVFPDRIEVHITERTPYAVWRLGSRHYLVDKTGRPLAAVASNTAPSLPRVAGEGAATAAAGLHALLAGHPALMSKVELAERIGERRWRLRLVDGGVIELPADDVAEVLPQALELANAAASAGRNEVDLRVAGRALAREGADGRRAAAQASEPQLAAWGI
jgi:cell division protein FtsQ